MLLVWIARQLLPFYSFAIFNVERFAAFIGQNCFSAKDDILPKADISFHCQALAVNQ